MAHSLRNPSLILVAQRSENLFSRKGLEDLQSRVNKPKTLEKKVEGGGEVEKIGRRGRQ